MRLLRFAVALCLTFALAAPAMAAVSPTSESPDAFKCPPYEVIGARGSGQTEKTLETNMGPEVHDFYSALRDLIGIGVVRGYGVHYPAVNVKSLDGAGAFLHVGFLGKYTDSVEEGTLDTERRIRVRHQECPDMRFILSGYSQGAQAVGDALKQSYVRKWVVAAAFFGDPYFNADSWSARGGDDPSAYGIFGPRPEWDSSLSGRVFSYCHYHDVICNVSNRESIPKVGDVYVRNPLDADVSAHVTPAYRLSVNGGRNDAGAAAREVARVLGFTPSPIPFTGPLDVAFVIDSTGSMSEEIDEVKKNVTDLAGVVSAIDPDYRLALVDYKDSPDQESDYQSRLDADFTKDIPAFQRQLNALEAEGGGDEPESVYSGLMTALNLGWRAGAKKLVVQIGDAPAKDPEPATGFTLRAVQVKALSVDPAAIDTIQSGESAEAKASFSAISDATGGEFLQLPNSEDLTGLVPAIANDIRRNTTAPAAALTVPSVAFAGRPVTLSAGESHDVGEPIAGYDWDFNGDGSFDASTTAPVASYTYPAPFSGTATVRVRSTSGLASLASAPIIVGLAPSTPPGKPRRLHKAVHGSKLMLSWSTGKGATPQWFTVFGRHGHPLERLPVVGDSRHTAKGKRRFFTASIRGLKRGHVYRFGVAAGNAAGESGRAGPVVVKTSSQRHRRRR